MTILTQDNRLLLIAPEIDANTLLQAWQLKKYDQFLSTHSDAQESLAWLNFEADEHE